MSGRPSPGQQVLKLWRQCSGLPFGRELFMLAFGSMVPYSGALGARVESLEPGHVIVRLRDRRGVRNHLNSVHALALGNLGELASGLAMTTALPGGIRSIVTGLHIEFRKKARGLLTAESRVTVPAVTGEDVEHDVIAEIRDEANEIVAVITVRWRLGLVPAS